VAEVSSGDTDARGKPEKLDEEKLMRCVGTMKYKYDDEKKEEVDAGFLVIYVSFWVRKPLSSW
jgi:hypothetical protein